VIGGSLTITSNGVLTESWRTRLMHRNHVEELRCFRCGGEIHVGERIHTNDAKTFDNRGNLSLVQKRVYHLSCFEGMFIEA
jgi:hypothetical protein